MSDGYFEDEYDDQPDYEQAPPNTGPKALRDAYEREKEARKALEERLAKLEEQDRKAKLTDRLKNAGVKDPDALGDYAKLIDPDKAEDFLTAVKRSMGYEVGEEPETPAVSDEDAAALAAVSGEPTGTAPTGAASDQAAVLGGVTNEDDFAKLMGWR